MNLMSSTHGNFKGLFVVWLGSGEFFRASQCWRKWSTGGIRASAGKPCINAVIDSLLTSFDGDLVQTVTAIQKELSTSSGVRHTLPEERSGIQQLFDSVTKHKSTLRSPGREFPYTRGQLALQGILGVHETPFNAQDQQNYDLEMPPPPDARELFLLGSRSLPRIFSGLWQMSSPAWGSAPTSKIMEQFASNVNHGFTAFDMADHYGDAEVVYGRFRAQYPFKDRLFTATKYCVFQPFQVTREAIRGNVSERCRRLQQEKIDLLQLHWHNYADPQYLDALRHLNEDERVDMVGLCNFDTENMQKVLDNGIKFYTNQVQFSLIDERPLRKMAPVCEKHNIKLLTYGTLCGGFLADKWLNKPEPDIYNKSITPSQRKYYGMIRSWGGWKLFQELLHTLRTVSDKHGVDISNAATRWVLDFPCVGAVLVGARMGVSDNSDANQATFGWSLDDQDRAAIEKVLAKSKRAEIFERLGDCGGEYR